MISGMESATYHFRDQLLDLGVFLIGAAKVAEIRHLESTGPEDISKIQASEFRPQRLSRALGEWYPRGWLFWKATRIHKGSPVAS